MWKKQFLENVIGWADIINIFKVLKQMERPLSYDRITLQKRQDLAKLVVFCGYSIAKAAKLLRIKDSTAKLIIKRYRQTGTFFQPKKGREETQKPIQTHNTNNIEGNLPNQAIQMNQYNLVGLTAEEANYLVCSWNSQYTWIYPQNYICNPIRPQNFVNILNPTLTFLKL